MLIKKVDFLRFRD